LIGQNIRIDKHFVLGSRVALTFSCERPLLAESSHSEQLDFHELSGCFREKRTFAPHIHWMRDNREIFEFVDGVGGYWSGWWL